MWQTDKHRYTNKATNFRQKWSVIAGRIRTTGSWHRAITPSSPTNSSIMVDGPIKLVSSLLLLFWFFKPRSILQKTLYMYQVLLPPMRTTGHLQAQVVVSIYVVSTLSMGTIEFVICAEWTCQETVKCECIIFLCPKNFDWSRDFKSSQPHKWELAGWSEDCNICRAPFSPVWGTWSLLEAEAMGNDI